MDTLAKDTAQRFGFELETEWDVEKNTDIPSTFSAIIDDPNLDADARDILGDDSPYPEVRSAVANTDDPSMPTSTIRSWIIGLFFVIIMAGMNFFYYRYPTVYIGNLAAQLLIFPFGRAWARFMPSISIFGLPLNPWPFTIKEHVLATVMANVSGLSAYATDVVAVQRVFYNQVYNFGYAWMIVMSTQLIGYSIGGVGRRFLVQPPSMIWPSILVNCALFNTLHSQYYSGIGSRGGITRERFFVYAFLCSFTWYFMPGYAFQALSFFSWVCWIAPKNVKVNQLFGYSSGLGMSLITFDWAQIAYIRSPLAMPWWAEANLTIGFIFFFWIVTPALYYSNTWFGAYLPISSCGSFDNTGAAYNLSRILNADSTINLDAYHSYSPLFISTTFAVSYALSFASITATLAHTFLYFRKQIWMQSRKAIQEQADIHARLMSVYPQVPDWWYAALFLTMFAFGVVAIEVWPTQLPVWAFILALVIAFIYVVPVGMIQAITNQQIGLNVISELIIGYMLPGRPVAMMLFKSWGYVTMSQALMFTSDFKLCHYMKVAPRPMFWGQVIATIVAGTVQLGVQSWMFSNIEDMCSPTQKDGFTCPSTEVFGTASIIWGVIGPSLQFSRGEVYYPLVFFFVIGALLPVAGYALGKRYPNSIFKYINIPIMFANAAYIPPATAANYVPWAIVGFIFQYVVRRKYFSWWTKYNYVLSAALESGVAICAIVIFFCLEYPRNGSIGKSSIQTWWGNTVFQDTADWKAVSLKRVASGQTFGPSTW